MLGRLLYAVRQLQLLLLLLPVRQGKGLCTALLHLWWCLRLHILWLLPLLLLLLGRSCRHFLLWRLHVSWRLAWLLLLPLLRWLVRLAALLPLLLLLAMPLSWPPLLLLLLLAWPLTWLLLLLVVAGPLLLLLLLLLPLAHRPTVAALDASAVRTCTCAVMWPAAATAAAKGHTAASVLARLSTTAPSSCLAPLLVCAPAYPMLRPRPCAAAPWCRCVSAAARGVSASALTFTDMSCCLPAAAPRACASVRAIAAVSRRLPAGARPCCRHCCGAAAAAAAMGCSSKWTPTAMRCCLLA